MDSTERLVKNNLKHQGYTDIVYEPDGNVPPDFLINGSIAVEVRRLNQNHDHGNQTKGLEEVAIPLWKRVDNLLSTYENKEGKESWFVHFRFSRPVEEWRKLRPKLENALNKFRDCTNQQLGVVANGRGFELEIFCRASKSHESLFVMGGCSDQESGGWVLSEMQKNIIYCATEKAQKIERVRKKYPAWWLALVDHIGYGLNEFDREQFKTSVSVEHSWEKILIVSPLDFRKWLEI
ncbi:MAG: hypothetical protein LAT61_03120 [Alcanivorax sp.]|nr:hypothetical protein [Alcanivorax sp.]